MRRTKRLTEDSNEGQMLAYITAYTRENAGRSPSIREMGEALGISSTSVVAYTLDRLVSRGLISRIPGQPRSIRVVGQEQKAQKAELYIYATRSVKSSQNGCCMHSLRVMYSEANGPVRLHAFSGQGPTREEARTAAALELLAWLENQ